MMKGEYHDRRLVWPVLIAGIYFILLLIGILGKDHGIAVALQIRKHCHELSDQIAKLTEENRLLSQETTRLRTDRRYIEKIAREELQMIGEREMVFVFPEQ